MPNSVLTEAIDRVAGGEDLAPDEASRVLAEIVEGNVSQGQAAAFLWYDRPAAPFAGSARPRRRRQRPSPAPRMHRRPRLRPAG